MGKRWSVTKQVSLRDVQEAYTELGDNEGQFKESDDQRRSLAQDVKREAKTKVKPGQGDRGDLLQ